MHPIPIIPFFPLTTFITFIPSFPRLNTCTHTTDPIHPFTLWGHPFFRAWNSLQSIHFTSLHFTALHCASLHFTDSFMCLSMQLFINPLQSHAIPFLPLHSLIRLIIFHDSMRRPIVSHAPVNYMVCGCVSAVVVLWCRRTAVHASASVSSKGLCPFRALWS